EVKLLHNTTDDIVQVRSKGLESFINTSKSREDEKFKQWIGKESVSFHEICRERYSAKPQKTSKRKRKGFLITISASTKFLIFIAVIVNSKCICNEVLDPSHKKVSYLKRAYTYQNLLNVASERNDDVGQADLEI
ncbi:hypothetical protein TSAR_004613, partial [Trichomalopsis sarcophagae]